MILLQNFVIAISFFYNFIVYSDIRYMLGESFDFALYLCCRHLNLINLNFLSGVPSNVRAAKKKGGLGGEGAQPPEPRRRRRRVARGAGAQRGVLLLRLPAALARVR